MYTSEIVVKNLNCGACTNRIKVRLQNLTGVFSVQIDTENATVKVVHNTSIRRQDIVKQLLNLGYLENK
jgi:copper chaperone CopZ